MTDIRLYRGKRCSSNDVDRIVEMFEAGSTGREIAEALGHHPGSVMSQIRRAGIVRPDSRIFPSRLYTAEQDAVLLEMRSAGATFRAVGEAIGKTTRSVQSRLEVLTWHQAVRDGVDEDPSVRRYLRPRKKGGPRLVWDGARVEQLRTLVAAGRTNAEIAETFGVSVAAVQVRKSIEGIAPRKTVPAEVASRIVDLTEAGRTIPEIVAETGETRSRVSFIIRRQGVIPQHCILRSDVRPFDAELLRLADAGTKFGAIARTLGMKHGSVCSRLLTLRRRQVIRERLAA